MAKFAEYNLKSSISAKEAMRSYLELLFCKKRRDVAPKPSFFARRD